MFELEKAITKWRKSLEKHPGLEPGYIEELEAHLRDKIKILTNQGTSEKEAYNRALKEFNLEEIAGEYYKARSRNKGSRPPWEASGWIPAMLPNYIKMALRGIQTRKQFAVINTTGLSIGIACCLLIFLYIFQQLQHDRFHPKPEHLFRITYEVTNKGNSTHYAVSVPGLVPALQKSFPAIEKAARISIPEDHVVRINGRFFKEASFFHADSSFFDIFGFPLLQGNPHTALSGPGKVVLSQHTAEKYFGETNPVGQTLHANYGQQTVELEVSGVTDASSQPSHLSFDLLASFETLQNIHPTVNDQNWWLRSVYSYVKFSEPGGAGILQSKLPSIIDRYMGELAQRSGSSYAFHLQSVRDIHLYSNLQQEIQPNGNIQYVYLFSSIAILVLLIACFII